MASFDIAMAKTLVHEGVGPTMDSNGYIAKYGINAQYNPDIDVKNLTKEKAIAIYKERYWHSLFDKIPNQELANQIFDWRVTSGGLAIKGLQNVLNSMGSNLKVDGVFGPNTLNTLLKYNQQTVLERYKIVRKSFYDRLYKSKPETYTFGMYASWIYRTTGERLKSAIADVKKKISSSGILKPILFATVGYGLYYGYKLWQQNKGPTYEH